MPRLHASRTGRIEKKVLIQAGPAVIYRALTEARALVQWFCDRASSDARVGGEMAVYWRAGKEGHKGRATFTRLVPRESVELRWVDEPSHVLSYTIRTRRGTTEVLMRDEDPSPQDDEVFAHLDAGWNGVLLELKDYCERRERSSRRRPAVTSAPSS
jgi:uncharacterized protein YndB with AHSA1/START domain